MFTPNLEVALGRDDPGPQMDRMPTVDYPAVKRWIGLGAEVNARGGVGLTALKVAVDRRDHRFVSYLLSRGAKVNLDSGRSDSPLLSACGSWSREPDLALVRILLKAGASPITDRPSDSPLIVAVSHLNFELVTLLLDAGAGAQQEPLDLALLSSATLTPLDRDLDNRQKAMKLLLSKGADPNALSVYGYTTLQEAVRAAQVDSVRVLLEHGGDAKRRCPDGTSVIKLAKDRRQLLPRRVDAIVRLLRAAGASE